MNKVPVAVRLTPSARDLIVKMSERMGLSQAGVLELAVRKLAASEGIALEESKEGGKENGDE